MNAIDFTPLYRSTVGFDRMASLLDSALQSQGSNYPPYNIESTEENKYTITLAVAGFTEADLNLQSERGVLTVSGKQEEEGEKNYLHRGIANRAFERKFQLADHVNVTGADLKNGLLVISLVKEVPEEMKPKTISINGAKPTIEHKDKAAA